jgi:ubiquinone/menaquinone biosynthesis C-methylase UbiE
MSGSWDGFHATKAGTGHVLRWPDELVVRIASRWLRSGERPRLVLDMQCGGGRHSVLLASMGLDVVSLDVSRVALGQVRAALAGSKLPAAMASAHSSRLPFGHAAFDALVAWRSLHVFSRAEQPAVVAEMARVVRASGRILFSTRSDRNVYDATAVGRDLPRPTDLTFAQLEALCAPLDVLEIEHTETTARNRSLRDAYWVVHARPRA